jgi:hypothetical protein
MIYKTIVFDLLQTTYTKKGGQIAALIVSKEIKLVYLKSLISEA